MKINKFLKKGGFALIDVLLGLVIFASVAVPLTSYFANSMHINKTNKLTVEANNLASEYLEMNILDSVILDTSIPAESVYDDDGQWQLLYREDGKYDVIMKVSRNADDIYQVTEPLDISSRDGMLYLDFFIDHELGIFEVLYSGITRIYVEQNANEASLNLDITKIRKQDPYDPDIYNDKIIVKYNGSQYEFAVGEEFTDIMLTGFSNFKTITVQNFDSNLYLDLYNPDEIDLQVVSGNINQIETLPDANMPDAEILAITVRTLYVGSNADNRNPNFNPLAELTTFKTQYVNGE